MKKTILTLALTAMVALGACQKKQEFIEFNYGGVIRSNGIGCVYVFATADYSQTMEITAECKKYKRGDKILVLK